MNELILTTGNPIVDAVGKINLSGNIIPEAWYQTILKDNTNKPDLLAILILGEIVYWYRPIIEKDEFSNQITYKKKFQADILQKSYKQLESKFGCSKRQAQESIRTLERLGVIQREVRVVEFAESGINNALFIRLIPEALFDITYPKNIEKSINAGGGDKNVTTPLQNRNHPSDENITTSLQKCNEGGDENVTYTKNTTETTTEITTTEEAVVEKTKNRLANLKLKEEDIISICKTADFDFNKISQAYNVFLNQTGKINNVVGWLIKAIENNYSSQGINKNKFTNYNQRDYDMAELEQKLLRH